MQSFKSLPLIHLAILALGPVALLLAFYALKQLKKANLAFTFLRKEQAALRKVVQALEPPTAAKAPDQEGAGKKSDDPQEIEPDDDGALAKMKVWYGKLPPLFKGLVWLVAALVLVVVSNNVKFGGNSDRDTASDDDDSAEVAKAKTTKAKAPVAAPQVDPCGVCKPDTSAGGVIDTTADGSYVWANACTGTGDCSKCKPVAACATKDADLRSAPPACNACESK